MELNHYRYNPLTGNTHQSLVIAKWFTFESVSVPEILKSKAIDSTEQQRCCLFNSLFPSIEVTEILQ